MQPLRRQSAAQSDMPGAWLRKGEKTMSDRAKTAQELRVAITQAEAETYVACVGERHRIIQAGLSAGLDALDRLAAAEGFRTAVIDALVVDGIYTNGHDADPRKAVNDLLAWEAKIALDPAVSQEAADLHAKLAAAEQEIAFKDKLIWTMRDSQLHTDAVAAEKRAEQAEARLREAEQACPCRHTTPCHPRCTCANPASSAGCRRCCKYGSPEQQRAMAEHLVDKEHADARLAAVQERLAAALRTQQFDYQALVEQLCAAIRDAVALCAPDAGIPTGERTEPEIHVLDATALVQREGFDCKQCGHRHGGRSLAYICIGCPCEARPDGPEHAR